MIRQVKMTDFKKEYSSLEIEIDRAIKRVLESGWYVLGNEVKSFESELAEFIGAKYAVGVACGTDALTIAIKSLGLRENDEIIIPANVYPTAFGVALSGAKVRLADVDPETLNISIDTIKKCLTKNTKAIVLVHLYGNPVDILPIKKLAKEKGIYLIEDCAQSIGAVYRGRKVGSFGDISCFSFYPTKNLGAYGDAGAIVTNSKKLFEKVKLARMYGEKERYESVLVGQNSRLDELQAAVLRTKMKYLADWNKKRRNIAKIYREEFKDLPIKIVKETESGESVYHLFVISVKDRQKLIDYLKTKNIDTGVHYPIPVHTTKSFLSLGYKKGDFPISEDACRNVLSLPINSQLSDSDVEYVISRVKNFFAAK